MGRQLEAEINRQSSHVLIKTISLTHLRPKHTHTHRQTHPPRSAVRHDLRDAFGRVILLRHTENPFDLSPPDHVSRGVCPLLSGDAKPPVDLEP